MKNLLSLGMILSKTQQKQVLGGGLPPCTLAPPGVPCYGGSGEEGTCIVNNRTRIYSCSDQCPDGTTPVGCII